MKVRGREGFDICCKSQMQSFGNWVDEEYGCWGQNLNRIQGFKFNSLNYRQKFRRVTLWGERDSMSRWAVKICDLLCEQVIKQEIGNKSET